MPRKPRRKGGTLRDGERRQLAYASRRAGVAPPEIGPGDRMRVLCDGGSRGNPGPAAVAAVLVDAHGAVLAQRAHRIGRATAAEAEYGAILLGLELAHAADAAEIEVRCDSKLAIERLLSGDGPADIVAAASAFEDVRWVWHPRAANEAVDALVRELLWPV
jgi:ribonuclease HI